jgi:hypothetical protein
MLNPSKRIYAYKVGMVAILSVVIGQAFGAFLSWVVEKQTFYRLKGDVYFIDTIGASTHRSIFWPCLSWQSIDLSLYLSPLATNRSYSDHISISAKHLGGFLIAAIHNIYKTYHDSDRLSRFTGDKPGD